LFGTMDEAKKESRESYLVIEDSLADDLKTEYRPGVKIDPATHLAAVDEKGGQLFDMQLLEAGTRFPLRIELALPDTEATRVRLLQGLAIALTGLEKKEIGLGARKRRGFGECLVKEWQVQSYDLKDPAQLVAWIESESGHPEEGQTILDKLGVKELPSDQRTRFSLEASFQMASSLLIRSGSGKADSPDMVHLKSKRAGDDRPVLSGTSLAGALRARALRIAHAAAPAQANELVDHVFGPAKIEEQEKRRKGKKPFASRALVREREVAGEERVQSRIRIDRFSGGTYPGALFEQQIIQGGQSSRVTVSIELRNPQERHIGLLLHLLKDLWTEDLPLGGEASVGRGRLKGLEASLAYYIAGQDQPLSWTIMRVNDQELKFEGHPASMLDGYAQSVGGGS
jgi:CRISPR/Cas system CSM-associated protein Csm3 (group 7 of RAMP superfamily)